MNQRSKPKVQRGPKMSPHPVPERPARTSLAQAGPGGPEPMEASLDGFPEHSPGVDGVYIISVAARILDVHPQTLRKYERLGLINPGRTMGMLRLYSGEDIRRVRLIQRLGEMGLNLAGVEFALSAAENLHLLDRRLQALAGDSPLRSAIEAEVGALLRSLNLSVEDSFPVA